MNDPTQFEQVDETCEFGGAVLYSESLGITAFFENDVPSKYETQKLKQLQFGIENEKIRQFEHECLIRLFQWSFLPPGKALDFSVCDEAFGCYKTQYRKRHLLEICQNASFLSTPDIKASSSDDAFLFAGNGEGAAGRLPLSAYSGFCLSERNVQYHHHEKAGHDAERTRVRMLA